jgi:hypothetical protein
MTRQEEEEIEKRMRLERTDAFDVGKCTESGGVVRGVYTGTFEWRQWLMKYMEIR